VAGLQPRAVPALSSSLPGGDAQVAPEVSDRQQLDVHTYVPEKPDIPGGLHLGRLSGERQHLIGAAGVALPLLCRQALGPDGLGFPEGLDNSSASFISPPCNWNRSRQWCWRREAAFRSTISHPRRTFERRAHEVMANWGAFAGRAQAISHKSETWPQIGVLFSRHSLYRNAARLFGGWGRRVSAARGVVDALVEAHYPVDVIPDWKLKDVVSSYALIVVPDWEDIGGEAAGIITAYVQKGGKALLIGAENAAMFPGAAGHPVCSARPPPECLRLRVQLCWPTSAASGRTWKPPEQRSSSSGIRPMTPARDSSGPPRSGTFWQGDAGGCAGPIGKIFAATHAPATREFVSRVVERLYTRILNLEAPPRLKQCSAGKAERLSFTC